MKPRKSGRVIDANGKSLEFGDTISVPGRGLMAVIGMTECCGVDLVVTGNIANGDLESPWLEHANRVEKQ